MADRPVIDESGKDAQDVEITPEMERAGLEELYDGKLSDLPYLVRSIYLAMEYQRRSSLNEGGGLGDDPLKVLKR
jgi:hypothetical protein